ncbi:stromal cell derived factor mayday [Tachypleus tridentatus]|uniref:stromal cell derived factor mayday n=1 Tax=Tachypleus tridentatus TaxID=6853 RepID=UPI003FD4EEAE
MFVGSLILMLSVCDTYVTCYPLFKGDNVSSNIDSYNKLSAEIKLSKSFESEIDFKNSQSKYVGISADKLSPEIVKPQDHLEGVRMERDGHLNEKFRKEVIIGSQVKEEKKMTDEEVLKDVFWKADNNKDKLITKKELEIWIATKVQEHIEQAAKDNFWIFTALDKNHNGRVSWEEYHLNFMLEQGFNKTFAENHSENHKTLDRKLKEKILLDKAAWFEAANSDPDALNIDEFLTFRHPEHSHVSLLNMVNDIISNLDTDGDEQLSETEFAEMPQDDDSKLSEENWKKERIREFKEFIDTNHDGKVNRQELLLYNDPENPVHSKREAEELISKADTNKDNCLSLQEVLAQKNIFLGSKMVDTARSFHDEF